MAEAASATWKKTASNAPIVPWSSAIGGAVWRAQLAARQVHFRKQLNEVGEKGEQDDNRQRHTQKPQNSSPSHGSIPVDVFLYTQTTDGPQSSFADQRFRPLRDTSGVRHQSVRCSIFHRMVARPPILASKWADHLRPKYSRRGMHGKTNIAGSRYEAFPRGPNTHCMRSNRRRRLAYPLRTKDSFLSNKENRLSASLFRRSAKV